MTQLSYLKQMLEDLELNLESKRLSYDQHYDMCRDINIEIDELESKIKHTKAAIDIVSLNKEKSVV